MKEYTVKEVLEFAQTVEQESYLFYGEAAIRLAEPDLMRLCRVLAENEIEHFNKLRTMAQQEPLSEDELRDHQVTSFPSEGPRVQSEPIPDETNARDILEIALRREKNTKSTYDMMATFTTISPEVQEVLSFLADEETTHIADVQRRLEEL